MGTEKAERRIVGTLHNQFSYGQDTGTGWLLLPVPCNATAITAEDSVSMPSGSLGLNSFQFRPVQASSCGSAHG